MFIGCIEFHKFLLEMVHKEPDLAEWIFNTVRIFIIVKMNIAVKILYCTVLYYTLLYCTILYYTVLCFTVLYFTVPIYPLVSVAAHRLTEEWGTDSFIAGPEQLELRLAYYT